jgi:microtubule-associated protein 1 light chain
MLNFKNKPIDDRKRVAENIMKKYSGRIPIIIEQGKYNNKLPMNNTKFIVPEDMTVAQLLYMLRSRIKLKDKEAIFLFFDGNLLNTNSILKEVYHNYKKEDGILYIYMSTENTFG